jgi:hypothetical protein
VLVSVGSTGDVYDNSMAESFLDTFKTALINDRVWRTRSQLELAIVEHIRLRNGSKHRFSGQDYQLYRRRSASQVDGAYEQAIVSRKTSKRLIVTVRHISAYTDCASHAWRLKRRLS